MSQRTATRCRKQLPTLRVLTYNIHKGADARGRTEGLRALRKAVHDLACDVAFLQEVVGAHWRTEHARDEHQAHFLAGAHWPYVVYGRTRARRSGHHGNAILSRTPILQWNDVDVSTNPFERRRLIHSILSWPTPGRRLHAICVHFGLFERGRRRQLAQLCELVQERIPADEPLVVAGDFNDWRRSASKALQACGLVEAHETVAGGPALTFPARFPLLTLDRIYVRGLHVEGVERPHGKEWHDLSDHAPLVARLRGL
ncbi:MAG: endonuclease/exonuclease/phosphatase family protein [Planctomycetota bacterium]